MHPEKFRKLGLKAPKGVLLYGPPGCSKTTIAKAIANSVDASFFSISGSELYSPYVGDSERIVRELFDRARSCRPAIIFIDEIDIMIGKRDFASSDSSSVSERILSAFLNELDGVTNSEGITILGATNRPDMIDAALMRPGRFDKMIHVSSPSAAGRLEILRIYSSKMTIAKDVDLGVLASDEVSNFYTGADLLAVCREAALCALREDMQNSTIVCPLISLQFYKLIYYRLCRISSEHLVQFLPH